jgi:hypothetical protein
LDQIVPRSFSLSQNFPNPFNPETHIQFCVAQKQTVSVRVYDVLGREVAILVDGVRTPGTYTAFWNARKISSGVYFYRLLVGGTPMLTRKMMVVR